ncbi:MAG TPA: alkaline phosphatase family protein [Longimicrobiales bacterium]|nr:alkaline phosphatase family protein [Longimicrobiales bacterium]
MTGRRWEDPDAGWLTRARRRFYRWYYHLKYLPFAAERRGRKESPGRGFVGIQIDALAFEDFERALQGGHMPFLRRLVHRDGWDLRRYPAGLPSATPAAQAAIFHGTKERIPAFRFYEKKDRRVIIGSQTSSMQYIRDRLPDRGVLSGGSSYVNLYDGGADRAVWTLSDRNRRPFLENLGGGRILVLLLFHPVRTLRMVLVAVLEYLREERDRLVSQIRGQNTHYWWYLPFLHIGTNVVLRELQTLSVLLDIYTGVPAIYTTYNAYDEFAHHFGPSTRTAYKSLRALDRRIREIFKIINRIPGRPYDVYILSDHGQTPSVPYRVRYGETLGDTVLSAEKHGVLVMAQTGEYAPAEQAVDFLVHELEGVATTSSLPTRKAGLGFSRWFRKHYKIFPLTAEVVRPLEEQHLVLTYSSSLAHIYWTDPDRPLRFEEIRDHPERRALYYFLVTHQGIGVVLTRMLDGVHAENSRGRALVTAEGDVEVLEGEDPLADFAPSRVERDAIIHLVGLENAGDLVLMGAYDPVADLQICFDDQVGAHGALGGRQFWPFLLTAPGLVPERHPIRDPLDLHPLFARYPIMDRLEEAGRDMARATTSS